MIKEISKVALYPINLHRKRLSILQFSFRLTLVALAFICTSASAAKYLYTVGNQFENNTVLAYKIKKNGRLIKLEGSPFSTNGGVGQGTPPFTQNGLIASPDGEYLFVTNILSNDIAIFRINDDGSLIHIRNVPTGGYTPATLAMSGDILYTAHLGTSVFFCYECDYRGFRFDRETEDLIPIPDSVIPLPLNPPGFALAIQFAPDGKTMIGTRFSENKIDSFQLDEETGLLTPSPGSPYSAEDNQPIGFAFSPIDPSLLFVSNVVELDEKPGTMSSYSIDYSNGVVSAIPGGPYSTDGEGAACWVALPSHGQDLYTTNTRTDSITHYKVNELGELTFVSNVQVPNVDGTNDEPLDMVITSDDKFLFTVNGGVPGLVGFHINDDGSLTLRGKKPKKLPKGSAPYGLVLIEK